MSETSERSSAYQRDGVEYLDRIVKLFGDFKRRGIEFTQPRPGVRILDAGCGTGEDARTLAALAGSRGRVIGIDSAPEMIAVARRRAAEAGIAVEFMQGDVYRLDFPDGFFDRVRADRLFQHLREPAAALRELMRVAAPGGRVVLLDVDWGSLVIDASDSGLAGRILARHCAGQVNAAAGRSLYGLMRRAALEDVEFIADTIVITELDIAAFVWGVDGFAGKAVAAGDITESEAKAWNTDLRDRDRAGAFFAAMTGFAARAKKPA